MSRADLHVHSKASNRPPEWILRQFGAPESYTEPKEVYRVCRERGMDFVTLSDHDTIDGALEIAHLPGVFLSEEVTVSFPEDGCQIHLLVTGINEAQHAEIQRLRGDVYALRDYLRQEDVICSVAHPLYRVNDRLTLAQLEKLFVLFNRFESLNGIHERRANALVHRILTALTPEVVADLAAKHRLEPWGPTPWVKTMTGGSDDHGGLYIATTFTETGEAATVADFLAHLRAGRHQPGGETGSSLRLVQSLYNIAREYYRRQFPELLGSRNDPFAQLLRELGVRPGDRTAPSLSFFRRAAPTVEDATFGTASKASQKSLASLLADVIRPLRRGRLSEALAALSHLAPLALSIAPYLVALKAQHKDADLLESASLRFLGERPEGNRPDRKAWFTDTLTDVNGVARTIRTLAGLSREHGRDLVTVTCSKERLPDDLRVARFKPLFEVPLPGYEPLTLSIPPVLEVLEHCERQRYSEILVSTPGPIGLLGLLCGKLLGIRVTGIYHTDFPQCVRHLTGSATLEDHTWTLMRHVFGAMDELYVASRYYRDLLAAHGFEAGKLTILPVAFAAEVEPEPAGRVQSAA